MASVRPAAIDVISGGAMRRFLLEVIPLFEQASTTTVTVRFALTRVARKEIEEGAPFDMALLPRPEIDGLVAAGKIAAGSQTDIVRSIVGLLVRADAPVPDIGSVAAFTDVLRRAKSISYSKGPSGMYVADLLGRLGLSSQMQDKTVFAIGRPVGEVIAGGEAEIGMQQIIENQPVKGARLVGPLPTALTNFVLYSAGFAAKIADQAAVRAFAAFLRSAQAVPIICDKGMEPA